jgi:hypothetical protein
VIKRLWGFAKARYRGIAKNLARAFSLFALANLYLVRRQLLPPQARCVLSASCALSSRDRAGRRGAVHEESHDRIVSYTSARLSRSRCPIP